jgi:hypothetical protein
MPVTFVATQRIAAQTMATHPLGVRKIHAHRHKMITLKNFACKEGAFSHGHTFDLWLPRLARVYAAMRFTTVTLVTNHNALSRWQMHATVSTAHHGFPMIRFTPI